MRTIESSGKSVDEAIFNGLIELGISIDEVEVEIIQHSYPDLDAEAFRVVKAMPIWKPGKHNVKAVRSRMNVPINFKIPQ